MKYRNVTMYGYGCPLEVKKTVRIEIHKHIKVLTLGSVKHPL